MAENMLEGQLTRLGLSAEQFFTACLTIQHSENESLREVVNYVPMSCDFFFLSYFVNWRFFFKVLSLDDFNRFNNMVSFGIRFARSNEYLAHGFFNQMQSRNQQLSFEASKRYTALPPAAGSFSWPSDPVSFLST